MTKLPPEMEAKLKVPLPPEAIKPHPTKPYLSSINSIYVTERLNQVFGTGAWKFKTEYLGDEPFKKKVKDKLVDARMVTVKVTFTVPEYDIEIEQFGGNDNDDKGDALKGSATDALTKIGSYLGIGQDVWKSGSKVDPSTGEIKERPKKAPDGLKTPDGNLLCTWKAKTGKVYWAIKTPEGEVLKWLNQGDYDTLKQRIVGDSPEAPFDTPPF